MEDGMMNNNFVGEQNEVRTFIDKSKFNEAIFKCKTVLETLNDNYIEDNHNKWFFNLRIAICYRKKGQFKKALNYVFESKNYTNDLKEHMECNWVLGNCYYSMKLYKKATLFFRQCSDYFTNNNMEDERIHMDFNIAKIENDDVKINRLLIEAYNMVNIDADSLSNAEWFFNNAYETLCEIYIDRNQLEIFEETIVKIKDRNIVDDLRNRMQVVNITNIL
jgi:tetratricopeptide (TPR) repeat protein